MKKISIIIPCFNAEDTISRCIDSIINQTYKNFEVIAINDGSSDRTVEILNAYAKNDNRIKVISKKNGGVGSARNIGLKLITGDYVQFIDSDDDLNCNMLFVLLNKICATNADMVVCKFKHACFKAYLPAGDYYIKNYKDALAYYSDFFTFNVPWNKMFKREVITEKFDETLKIFEDGIFQLSNFKNINKITVIDDELYNYFTAVNTGSLVNNFLKSKFWLTKEGYWFKCNNLKHIYHSILQPLYNDTTEFLYARYFDMAFWEMVKLIDSGLSKEIVALEMNSIFNEKDFIESLGEKVILTDYNLNEFIDECFEIYNLSKMDNKIQPYHEFVNTFYKVMTTEINSTMLMGV